MGDSQLLLVYFMEPNKPHPPENSQPEPPQKDTANSVGRGMLFIFWIIMLGIATFFTQEYLEKKENPNQELNTYTNSAGQKEVVLQRNGYGHYVSSGKINGVDVTFFLDTGATNISIPQHIADKIGLKRGVRYQSSTANGTIDVYNTYLDSVQLGDIILYDLQGSINPHYEDDDILLGMSFLKHLELNQKGRTLILRH